MKKINTLLIACAAVAAAVSCAKETDQNVTPVLSKITFQVNADVLGDTEATRAIFDAGAVSFAANDQISVFDGVGNQPFTTTAGGAAAEFTGDAAAADVYNVLSPYQADATCVGNVITATIPKVQTAVKDGVDPAALVAVARTTSTGEIHLKNVVGLLKVTVPYNNQVKNIQVAAGPSRNVDIAGSIKITTPSTSEEAPFYVLNDEAEKVTCVTLVPQEGDEYIAAGTYYIAVLFKTYEGGLTVAYLTNEESVDLLRAKTGTANAVVGRSKMLNLGSLVAGLGEYVKFGEAVLNAGTEINLQMKKMATPTITAISQTENTITRIEIKANTLDGGAASVTLSSTASSAFVPVYAILRGTVLTLYTCASYVQLGGEAGGGSVFRNFGALESIDFAALRTRGSTNTLFRFLANCPNLLEADLSSLNTNAVTNMASVFANCSKLRNVNLTGWSTTNVVGTGNDTGFHTMFLSCGDLKEVHLGSAFKPNDGVFVTSMFNGAALNHGGTPCKVYCSDAMWNWLSDGLDGEHPLNTTTGFHLVRFTHITE